MTGISTGQCCTNCAEPSCLIIAWCPPETINRSAPAEAIYGAYLAHCSCTHTSNTHPHTHAHTRTTHPHTLTLTTQVWTPLPYFSASTFASPPTTSPLPIATARTQSTGALCLLSQQYVRCVFTCGCVWLYVVVCFVMCVVCCVFACCVLCLLVCVLCVYVLISAG